MTARQEAAVEELENQLDTHSRGAFCVIVSDRGLGEERALSLLREAIELEDAGRIKKSLSECFMDLCQRDAARQGIDLGFQWSWALAATAPLNAQGAFWLKPFVAAPVRWEAEHPEAPDDRETWAAVHSIGWVGVGSKG